jgi:hypothetical protein
LEFGKFRRRTHPRREMEGVTIEAKYVSEFCLAEASGVPQQSFEYGLEPPGELEMTRSTSELAACCSNASRNCRRAASNSR